MKPIVTVTLNPAIDGASETEVVRHTRKIRTFNERFDPGGGGVNVARVIHALGGDALAVYLGGGATGGVLEELLAAQRVPGWRISVADHTRISQTVFERSTGLEYRFVPEGPLIRPHECDALLSALDTLDFDYLVASGSVPRGIPEDVFATLGETARSKGARYVLDTSGEPLRRAFEVGGIHLVKPSLGEFEFLIGEPLDTPDRIEAAVRSAGLRGKAELLAVSLGREGAILAQGGDVLRMAAPTVPTRSATGAGDSFVAAMTLALARGASAMEAFRWGMAAGSAAVLSPGTGLCARSDVEALFAALGTSST